MASEQAWELPVLSEILWLLESMRKGLRGEGAGLKTYVVNPVHNGKMGLISYDKLSADGLMPKLESIDGINTVNRKDGLSDSFFSVYISERADREDIEIIFQRIGEVCAGHAEDEG